LGVVEEKEHLEMGLIIIEMLSIFGAIREDNEVKECGRRM